MEVTNSNFQTILPDLEKDVENCTFLSIDCEMTGLNITHNINAFDTPKGYYEKVRRNCKEFLVIQYGLSIFRYEPKDNNFKQSSYNFYIFRTPANRNIPDQRFLCQASSIAFLVSNGFDFNKLFKEGISYLNEDEIARYKSKLEESYNKRIDAINETSSSTDSSISVPENARQFVDDVIEKIDKFLQTDETEIELPRCNPFFRKLIYQTREEKYADRISLETRQVENDRILFVTKLKSKEEEKLIEKQKYDDQLIELESFIGFSKVLKIIIKSNKLIIGHNLCLDFLHSIDKFVSPLPAEYEDFKELAHCLFPKVLDTKYMSSLEPFKDLIVSNILGQLLDTVSEKPFNIPKVEIQDGAQGYCKSDEKEHEAGYDAFITGLCFLAMWKYLGVSKGKSDKGTFSDFDLLEPYMNKIFLMILTENQYVNLGGEDLNPSRDHVFYMTFPREWKSGNISQLFSPFGNVYIAWIDETSAYVGLYKKDQAGLALSSLSHGEQYTLMTYAKRQALLAGITTPLVSPMPSRKRKSMEPPPPTKKRRTGSLNNSDTMSSSKRSIDRIDEQEEVDEGSDAKQNKKMFSEDANWD